MTLFIVRLMIPICTTYNLCSLRIQLALIYFRQFWGNATFTFESKKSYTQQDATIYTCSYFYTGNFTILTRESGYSNCLKLFCKDRQYPQNGRFWPLWERLIKHLFVNSRHFIF